MNKETSNKKESVLKILAIAGFIGIIILIAWASIQLVSVVPSAFSSLASLAESVNDPNDSNDEEREIDSLTVTSNTMLADVGEAVEIDWNTARENGSYVFSYECTDGVAIDLQNTSGMQSIQCGNNYNLGNVDSTTIVINSEKNRYADIAYSISFLGTNDTRPRAAGTGTLTVFNSSISSDVAFNDTDEAEETESEPDVQTPDPNTPPTPSTPPFSPTPEYIQEYVYAIPASDPNGNSNLAARYLFVGEIKNNSFIPGALEEGEDGAIQFEVKNIGTKTSKKWSFTVNLPGDVDYTSESQTALKPNERAILTVGFNGAEVRSHTFDVEVDVSADSNTTNNDFSQRVTFID